MKPCASAPLRPCHLLPAAKIFAMIVSAVSLALFFSSAGLAQSGDGPIVPQSPVETPPPTGTPVSAELAGPVEDSPQNGSIEVIAAPGDPIFGRVLLQGRLQHDGTKIFLVEMSCEEFLADTWQDRLEATTLTNEEGYFKIGPAEQINFGCLQVVKQGYLNGQAEFPDGNLGTITLPGGDVTNDNLINIFDLAYLGTHYGDKNLDVDINGDGVVNIFDLVLAASNFGQKGPTDVWEK